MALFIERRLRQVGRKLSSLREELRITEEQLTHLSDVTDDARIRALVSDAPMETSEHVDAERTSSAMARHRSDLKAQIEQLESRQDDLLDQMSGGSG